MHFPIPADRKAVRLFEIVQNRGAFEAETPDENWRIYDGVLGGSTRTALTRGYRLGFKQKSPVRTRVKPVPPPASTRHQIMTTYCP